MAAERTAEIWTSKSFWQLNLKKKIGSKEFFLGGNHKKKIYNTSTKFLMAKTKCFKVKDAY